MKPISRFIMLATPGWRSSRTQATGSLLIGIGIFASTLTIAHVAQAGEDNTPMQAVKNTVTELLHIVKEQEDTSRLNQRRWDVEQVIRRHVSYDEMAKRCLGEPWTGLDDSQREEFVGLFVQMLRDALANRIFEYSDERILYLSEQQEQGFAKVGP